ncbi:hypothetical protein [Acidisphaera sp. L21]|uniref:TolB family protein n=1 Tax=Acidisphaera sp. L21 TaxID=1641851 RepID=UPI00131ADF9E|nr:hypothetical protein [Acidisphaera sp. L21]
MKTIRMPSMLRRGFVLGGLASAKLLSLSRTSAAARPACAFPQAAGSAGRLVKRTVASPDNTYATYPHANGFLPDGRLVLAQRTDPQTVQYAAIDLTGASQSPAPLATLRGVRMYYAISHTGVLVAPTLFGAEFVDLAKGGKSILRWEDPEYKADPHRVSQRLRMAQDVDIAADGRQALLTRVVYGDKKEVVASSILLIDLATGTATTIAKSAADPATGTIDPLDHAHFSPADPEYICFCDAHPNTTRRMWIWHATKANPARPLFDQSAQPKPLLFTHERALFDRPAMLAIVYGSSSGGPRGLYELPLSGAAPRLVSESNRDLHCNASRDGRWYIVSLQGTADTTSSAGLLDLCARPGGAADPDWLRSAKGYSFSDVVIVNAKTGERAFLYRAANANEGQPYEVQPAISPDGRWVVLKDARRRNVLCLEIDQTTRPSCKASWPPDPAATPAPDRVYPAVRYPRDTMQACTAARRGWSDANTALTAEVGVAFATRSAAVCACLLQRCRSVW